MTERTNEKMKGTLMTASTGMGEHAAAKVAVVPKKAGTNKKLLLAVFVVAGILAIGGIAAGVVFGLRGAGGAALVMPLVTPAVLAATPKALTSIDGVLRRRVLWHEDSAYTKTDKLDPVYLRDEFFACPTPPCNNNIIPLLQGVDQSLRDLNTRVIPNDRSGCSSKEPVKHELNFAGQIIEMYFSCYAKKDPSPTDMANDNSGQSPLWMWGFNNGSVYTFTGAANWGTMAIIATPDPNNNQSRNSVEIWATVGAYYGTNPTPTCGAQHQFHLKAGPINETNTTTNIADGDLSTMAIEYSMGGNAVFCGGQFKSVGANIYFKGSKTRGLADGGGWHSPAGMQDCGQVDDLCVDGKNLSMVANCTENEKQFKIPALGRKGFRWASDFCTSWFTDRQPGAILEFTASAYPGGNLNTVVSDGTTNSTSFFGPTEPLPGLTRCIGF
jgi:hypothetical protein